MKYVGGVPAATYHPLANLRGSVDKAWFGARREICVYDGTLPTSGLILA